MLSRLEGFARYTGGLGLLAWRATVAAATPPYEGRAWIRQMELLGVKSFGVACLTTIFTGMVLALQTAYSLPALGVKYYIGTVVSKSVVRELGPILVALIVGGRIGAGMTAELGTMKVTEQIDALRAMGADPVRKLVAPKLVATVVMLPVLTALGNALGVAGGMVVAVYQLDLSPGFYANDVLDALRIGDIGSGLGKSVFFAFYIAIIGCHGGLTCTGGADGVGRATTRTVVTSAVLVLVSDFFLTKLFHLVF